VKRVTLALGDLLRSLQARGFACHTTLPPATPIAGVQLDSRKIRPDDLFIALSGHRADGISFARDAVRAGAVAVVCPQGAATFPPTFRPSSSTMPRYLRADLRTRCGSPRRRSEP
jgi:UDP-N-acetylmuramyl pentapeptide synthase